MRFPLLTTGLCLAAAGSTYAAEATLYGVVNKAVMAYDDGQSTQTNVVDNNMESTRFGVGVEQKVGRGLTISGLLETDMRSNPSNQMTQNTTAAQSTTPANITNSFTERMARVGLASDQFGALFIGQQDNATDDTFTHDLTAANSWVNANVAAFGGGLIFRSEAGGVYTAQSLGGTNVSIGNLALGMDGSLDASDSIRYNTPEFKGFDGSVSFAQGGNVDTALRYDHAFGAFEVDSAVGYKFINTNLATDSNVADGQLFASFSVQHKSGFGGSLSYTQQSVANASAGVDDPSGWYAKLGYAWDKFGIAADYSHYDNSIISTTGNEYSALGLGGQWDVMDGVLLGASYHNHSAKISGVSNIQDIDVLAMGMKVKF